MISALRSTVFSAITVFCLLTDAVIACAQTPAPGPAETQPAAQLSRLGQALPLVSWDPQGRGVLIAVAPDNVTAAEYRIGKAVAQPEDDPTDDEACAPLFPPREGYGLNVSLVARHFLATIPASRDIIDPAIPQAGTGLAERLAAIARTPGLAVLAIQNAEARGYSLDLGINRSYGDIFGYSLANRLSFLRQNGYDPIDMEPEVPLDGRIGAMTRLPYMENEGRSDGSSAPYGGMEAAQAQWLAYRANQQGEMLKIVGAGIRSASPSISIFVSPTGGALFDSGNSHFEPWIRTDSDPLTQNNVLAPSPAERKALEKSGVLPLSLLTEAQNAQLQAGMKDAVRRRELAHADWPDFHADSFIIEEGNLALTLVLPGIGDIRTDYIVIEPRDREDEVHAEPSAGLPISARNMILAATAPRDSAEAERLTAAAAAHGFQQLWIKTPGDASAITALAECVAAGVPHHLPVGALMSLLRAPAGSLPPSHQTLNIHGETGTAWAAHMNHWMDNEVVASQETPYHVAAEDVEDPNAPGLWADRAQSLVAIASNPGLAGLALCDAIAPGYQGARWPGGRFSGDSFGYTPANRLAFLRAEGYDPTDVDIEYSFGWETWATALPLVDTDSAEAVAGYTAHGQTAPVLTKWRSLLAGQQTAALNSLHTTLFAAIPRLPLFVCASGCDDPFAASYFFQLWDRAPRAPTLREEDKIAKSADLREKCYRFNAFHCGEFARVQRENPQERTNTGAEWIAQYLKPPASTKGGSDETLVLDLTTYPIADLITLIDKLFAPTTAAAE